MKKVIIMTIAALTVAVAAQAAEVSTYVDFASAYVFRGVTFNNGLVMQPGAEISGLPIPEEYGSVAFGIWANYDVDEIGNDEEISEVDYYISYTLPIEALDISIGYCEYDYPDSDSENDQELSVSLGSAIGTNGLYASVGIYYGLGGGIDESWYIQPALDYEVALSDALTASAGVAVGYVIADDGKDGFNDATASIGLGYALTENWSVSAGLTYIAQLNEGVLGDAYIDPVKGQQSGYDVDLVATVGVGCDF